ncbi:glycosyltransferase family 2 protein [Parendozoicomonas sp. Alg238-R29]|uniref:glycosyltransferase family 2 protein n=1 Tax=Parendozoicomonas sp. Alg238-R29 TaxID=2993446 RepID=UPI00248E86B3|nr:glycosyltransferase family 2 protein [Parendozoicomonas sp. Alg238-R29]
MNPLIKFPVSHSLPSVEEERILLSIIVPAYNESSVIDQFHSRLTAVLDGMAAPSEIIYINDGSSDDTWRKLQVLPESSSEQVLISLSRNFGKEAAMSAGLEASRGDAVILIDSDLQDPPELIPDMLAQWRGGYDIVNMRRRKRHGENWFKRTSAAAFYRVLNKLSDIHIPENVGDFRLLSRRVVDHINALPERTRYMKGLFAWSGFCQKEILFDRDPRLAGKTKWHTFKLIGLAFEGITSFSVHPLKLATFTGISISLLSLVFAFVLAFKNVAYGVPVAGYTSMTVVMLFLGGIQLLAIGLLGEYVGRIFIESKQRPTYLTMKKITKPAASRLQKAHL